MLSKRIIACLDVRDGQVVKGINFEGLRSAGDPAELARRYNAEGIDELVILDITATLERRRALADTIRAVAKELFIPLAVGGGIRTEAHGGREEQFPEAGRLTNLGEAERDAAVRVQAEQRMTRGCKVHAPQHRRDLRVQRAVANRVPRVAGSGREIRDRDLRRDGHGRLAVRHKKPLHELQFMRQCLMALKILLTYCYLSVYFF